jgi:hypothetical protein
MVHRIGIASQEIFAYDVSGEFLLHCGLMQTSRLIVRRPESPSLGSS